MRLLGGRPTRPPCLRFTERALPRRQLLPVALLLLLGLSGCGPLAGPAGLPAVPAEPRVAPAARTGVESSEPGRAETVSQAYTAKLQLTPSHAEVGATVQVSGSGYPPGAEVGLVWYTVQGRYELDGLELVGQRYDPTSRLLATVRADPSGSINTSLQVPLDYGGSHDLRGVVGDREVSQAGLTVLPTFSISPREGPVGTMIEVRIAGVDWQPQISSWPILYDNRPAGVMTAVTTGGVAVGRLRAAGPVGEHYLSIWHNSVYPTPFLNFKDGAFKDVPGAEFSFRVTSDPGPAAPVVERSLATGNPFPAGAPSAGPGPGQLSLSANRGVVGQRVTLRGSGLPANTQMALRWGTLARNWTATAFTAQAKMDQTRVLGNVQTGPDGAFVRELAIPDDLGGIHRLDVLQGEQVLATTSLFVESSLVSFGPSRVRVGEEIKIRLNGLGTATYNNNVYAVTYDNAQIGYICGFSAGGAIEFTIRATGGPGTHLIDLYPFIWKSKDQAGDAMPRLYGVPMLTYADDHPWRVTPAIRLAVEIVE
ncbi:MAG: hypothetical protein HY690_12940 [Chloroflexi bacterium]|nr:hypothetical protein [Chloroflexota bacterium]